MEELSDENDFTHAYFHSNKIHLYVRPVSNRKHKNGLHSVGVEKKSENVKTFVFFFRSIVDDSEMYDQQKPFRLNELVRISAFLNNLVFKMLWNEMVDGKYVMARRLIFRLFSSNPKKARALWTFSENCMLS